MYFEGYDTKREWLMNTDSFMKRVGKVIDRELAEEYGVSPTLVFSIRVDERKEPHRKHKKKTVRIRKLPTDEILLNDYNELDSIQKVADKYGATKQAVSKRLRNYFASRANASR